MQKGFFKKVENTLGLIVKKLDLLLLEHPSTAGTVVELNRMQLGLIDISDIITDKDDDLEYLKDAESIYNNPVFHNELKKIVQTQLEFIGCQAAGTDEVFVGRGTINGASLMKERFDMLHVKFLESIEPEETMAIGK